MKLARCVAALVLLPGIAQAAPCIKYGARTVSGIVLREMFYGPPNFGEDPKTDQRGFYPVLKLDKPLYMCADPSDGFADKPVLSREMQMIFLHSPVDKSWYGKRVTVSGILFARETASHHTPVMLTVGQIKVP